jgi:hypothetical protein
MPETFRIATEEAFAVPEQFDAYRALGRITWRTTPATPSERSTSACVTR